MGCPRGEGEEGGEGGVSQLLSFVAELLVIGWWEIQVAELICE